MQILITGATGGIGSKLTNHLISQKNTIIALSRNNQSLQKLKSKTKNNNLITIKTEISDPISVKNALKKIKKLDVLINCAAILQPVGPFLENNLNDWKKNIHTNLLGTVYTCYYSLPLLLNSKKGKIINFSGGGSAYPRANHSAYSTSKAAVVRFTEDLALEYPALDINAIAPGAHKTNMWSHETHDPEPVEWGNMQQLLNFIDFLISGKSNGITGKFIHYKDQWENFNYKKMKKDIYTLRRIES